MHRILLVSPNPAALAVFIQSLQAGVKDTIKLASSAQDALELIPGAAPDLIVLDEIPGAPPDFELVRKIMHRNALINVAMISRMTEQEFHDAAEGLGILMQLPPGPGRPEAEALLSSLNRMETGS
jgi:chemotaxis response regulator CheB